MRPSSHGLTNGPSPARLADIFSDFRPQIVAEPFSDFSGLHTSADLFCEVAPASIDEVVGVVRLARRYGVPLRTRGRNHNLSGSSLPAGHELSVRTDKLCRLSFEEAGTVTAGSGLVLWIVSALLNDHGLTLPVVNFGYPAATVGGYISAGGYGPGSVEYGGFWENVAEITLVDGEGRVQRLQRSDPSFPWVFGAMGQLGIIVEAKLDVIPSESGVPSSYPKGVTVAPEIIRRRELSTDTDPRRAVRGKLMYWLTVFVSRSQAPEAEHRMTTLENKYTDTIDFLERHICPINYRWVVAPLVYPHAERFVAVGTWGWYDRAAPGAVERVKALDDEFTWLALARKYYRYIQSELPSGPKVYELHWGRRTYAELRELKTRHDPDAILNPGWVFPVGTD
jgi:FAD/FMN-containing dehydrogenase